MLATTFDLFKAGLRTDPTVTPAERNRLLALLRNDATPTAPAPQVQPASAARILTRLATAARFSRSVRFVDLLARQGALKRVRLPGRVRACGFLESDVIALMSGSHKAET